MTFIDKNFDVNVANCIRKCCNNESSDNYDIFSIKIKEKCEKIQSEFTKNQ